MLNKNATSGGTTENVSSTGASNPGTELALIKGITELPQILPELDEDELFNIMQDTEPIQNLVEKKFKITGIKSGWTLVPKNKKKNGNETPETVDEDGNPFVKDDEMEEAYRVIVITNIGTYHSFSKTFNLALVSAYNEFGRRMMDKTFVISSRVRGAGEGTRASYVMRSVKA